MGNIERERKKADSRCFIALIRGRVINRRQRPAHAFHVFADNMELCLIMSKGGGRRVILQLRLSYNSLYWFCCDRYQIELSELHSSKFELKSDIPKQNVDYNKRFET